MSIVNCKKSYLSPRTFCYVLFFHWSGMEVETLSRNINFAQQPGLKNKFQTQNWKLQPSPKRLYFENCFYQIKWLKIHPICLCNIKYSPFRGNAPYFQSSFFPISSPMRGCLTLRGQLTNPAGQSPNPI